MSNLNEILKLSQNGDPRQLIALCEQHLAQNPHHYESNFALGCIWAERNQYIQAHDYFEKAYQQRPENRAIIMRYGLILDKMQRHNEAIAQLSKLLPKNGEALIDESQQAIIQICKIYCYLRQFDDALAFISQFKNIYGLLAFVLEWGRVMAGMGKTNEAYQAIAKIIISDSDKINFALWCEENYLHREALAIYQTIPDTSEQYYAAINNTINQYMILGEYIKGMATHEAALKLFPNDQHLLWNYSLNKLSLYQFNAFCEYENRWVTPNFMPYTRHYDIPKWDGKSDIAGKNLLVQCEQGIGDQLFFFSMLSVLHQTNANIFISCNERLEHILRRSYPEFTIIAGGGELSEPQLCAQYNINCYMHLGTIPYYFNLPDANPLPAYLKPNPHLVRQIKEFLANQYPNQKIVGFTWHSIGVNGEHRSIPPEKWVNILKCENIAWINLQYGTIFHFLRRFKQAGITNIGKIPALDINFNFEHLIALIAALDGVVMIRNLTAYFTNFLGVPGLVLLNRESDFRFGLEGEYSPWFENLRIVRQHHSGDWQETLESAEKIIQEFSKTPKGSKF